MKTKLQGNNKLFTSSKRSGSARTVKYTTQWRTLREVHDSVAHARSSTRLGTKVSNEHKTSVIQQQPRMTSHDKST